jgi:hypothetical protein
VAAVVAAVVGELFAWNATCFSAACLFCADPAAPAATLAEGSGDPARLLSFDEPVGEAPQLPRAIVAAMDNPYHQPVRRLEKPIRFIASHPKKGFIFHGTLATRHRKAITVSVTEMGIYADRNLNLLKDAAVLTVSRAID